MSVISKLDVSILGFRDRSGRVKRKIFLRDGMLCVVDDHNVAVDDFAATAQVNFDCGLF